MDGAGANNDKQARVLPGQDALDGLTASRYCCQGRITGRHLLLEVLRVDECFLAQHIQTINLDVVHHKFPIPA